MRLLHRATDVSIRKYAENYRKFTEIYNNTETRRIPVGQISYSSIGGLSLFNGIAHCSGQLQCNDAAKCGITAAPVSL